MKKTVKCLLLILALFAGILPAGAQTLILRYSFTNYFDGEYPQSGLMQANDGNLYGTTFGGGSHLAGSVFRVTATGVMAPLYSFTGGSDGGNPNTLMQASDGNLYGTASGGGNSSQDGTIFRITTNGVLTPLYTFTGGHDGANPYCTLVQAGDGNLYGTTSVGGTNGYGTIFRITTGGTGAFTSLYSFTNGHDGGEPEAGLVQASDGNLYGTTYEGGTNNFGTVFRVTTSGAVTPLWSFTDGHDGGEPEAGLLQASDGNLYGTTYEGGTNNFGTVFRVTTSGAVTPLWSFTDGHDGGEPEASLMQAGDGYLYGTAYEGGTNNDGAIFRITNGVLTPLYSFSGGNGRGPLAGLIQGRDGNLYGTTEFGGANNFGTVFKVVPPPPALNILLNSNQSFLYWPGSNVYEALLSTTNLASPDWVVVSNAAPAVAVTVTVTNSSYKQYFQLENTQALFSLYSFTNGNDGGNPEGSLVQAGDGNLYGTTYNGGTNGYGTVFRITTNGAFASLYSFVSFYLSGETNGANPAAALVQASDGNLYGTTLKGGPDHGGSNIDEGVVFRITTNGVFTRLYPFTGNNDGANPQAGLIQASDGNLYGTTGAGGTNRDGTFFRITLGGVFSSLYSFTGGADGSSPGGLVQASDGNLYGTAYFGGTNNDGAIFRITTNGFLTPLYSFTAGADGALPDDLIQANDGNLYGTAAEGGTNNNGTVFRIATNGAFTLLYSFTGGVDGSLPAGLVQASDGYIYGSTVGPGDNQLVYGTIFRISLSGVFTLVYGSAQDSGSLVQGSDGNFYGTAQSGGAGYGMVFKYGLPPPALNVFPDGKQSFLYWPGSNTNYVHVLQSTANLASPNWVNVSNVTPAVAVIVTLTNSLPAQFFRLAAP